MNERECETDAKCLLYDGYTHTVFVAYSREGRGQITRLVAKGEEEEEDEKANYVPPPSSPAINGVSGLSLSHPLSFLPSFLVTHVRGTCVVQVVVSTHTHMKERERAI